MVNKSIEGGINFSDFRVANHKEIAKQYKEAEESGVLAPEKVEARIKNLEIECEARKARFKKVFEVAGEFAKNF